MLEIEYATPPIELFGWRGISIETDNNMSFSESDRRNLTTQLEKIETQLKEEQLRIELLIKNLSAKGNFTLDEVVVSCKLIYYSGEH